MTTSKFRAASGSGTTDFELPNPNGRAAAVSSRPVALSTEDKAALDLVNTVLGTTAGAKVVTDANGTVQQYLRGIVTFFANALGAGTAAASLRVTLASDDPAVATLGATTGTKVVTDANGTIQQYLRGIVTFLVNALGAGTAAAANRVTLASDDPAVTAIGAKGNSAATDSTSSWSAIALLKGLFAKKVVLQSKIVTGSLTLMSGSAYTVGYNMDTVKQLTFSEAAGTTIKIEQVEIWIGGASFTGGQAFSLIYYLFPMLPVGTYTDNTANVVGATDGATRPIFRSVANTNAPTTNMSGPTYFDNAPAAWLTLDGSSKLYFVLVANGAWNITTPYCQIKITYTVPAAP